MKVILVPSDFSACANNAYLYACQIAQKLNAKILLTHVFHVPVIDPNIPADMIENMISNMRLSSLKNFQVADQYVKDKMGKESFNKLLVEHLLRQGFAVAEIEELANEIAPDLIIMGTQGASGIKKIIGSNASSLINRSHIPVLVVPEDATFTGIENILYASDFSQGEYKMIDQLLQFAKIFSAKIICLHVHRKNELIHEVRLQELKDYFNNELQMRYIEFAFVENDHVLEGISNYLDNNPFDMLAMLTHHRGFFEKIFHRSLTRKMAFHATTPLLAFHN